MIPIVCWSSSWGGGQDRPGKGNRSDLLKGAAAGGLLGQPFALTLVTAMVAAAKADGHIDADEQSAVFKQVGEMGLDTESKAFVFDALSRPVDVKALAAAVDGVGQASEVYLVSRLAIDVDHPAERAHLEVLSSRLGLPADLVAHPDHQVDDAPAWPTSGNFRGRPKLSGSRARKYAIASG